MKAKRIILFFLILSALIPNPLVKADPGWLTGWDYRKSHYITGSVAGAQTNYQMSFSIHYGAGADIGNDVYLDSKSRTDFGDVRFTNEGGTLLDYWIEEKTDSANAVFWVEIDTIPESPDNKTIYIYYGNGGVTTISNIVSTFIFADDFELGNLTRWTTAGVSWSAQGTTVKHGSYAAQGVAHATDRVLSKTISEIPKARVMFYTRCAVSADLKKFYNFRPQGTQYIMVMHNGHFQYFDGAYKNYPTDKTYSINTWYKVTLLLDYDTDKFKVYIDDTYYGEVSTVLTGTGLTNSEHIASSTVHSNTGYLDDFCIAKYVDPEPTHGDWGEEEEPPVLEAPNKLFGAGFNASAPYVILRWASNLTDINFFEIQNSTDKISWDYLGQSTTNQYTDLQVTNGLERFYRIRACNYTGGAWDNSTFTDINFEKVYFVSEGGGLFPGLAIGISLLIIGAIYALEKRR